MNLNDRLLAVWTRFIGFLLAPLAMLSVVLQWSSVVQLALTLLMGIAVFGTQLGLTRTRRRR